MTKKKRNKSVIIKAMYNLYIFCINQ